jgi:hypothetical protein
VASTNPAPAHAPSIAAITGVLMVSGKQWLWRNSGGVPSGYGGNPARVRSYSPPDAPMPESSSVCAPTQKSGPVPVSTTTRTSGSSCAWWSAHRYSTAMVPPHAFRRSGQSSATVATPASTW